MKSFAVIASAVLLALGGAACESSDDKSSEAGNQPDATSGAEVTVTMSPAAAPDAKGNAMAACKEQPGFVKVIDSGDATTFRIDLSGSTYAQQRDLVKCLGNQQGVHSVVGNK